MASSNCVADVRRVLAKAIAAKDTTSQEPSKWAAQAGYNGSAASPLRQHMARISGNGCGRSRRYPKMTALELTEALDLADRFAAEKDQRKREALSKRIGTKVRPAQVSGAQAAKRQAKSQEKARSAARKGTATAKKASPPANVKAAAAPAAPATPEATPVS